MDNLIKRTAWAIGVIKTDKDLDRGIEDVALAKILGTNHTTLAVYRNGKGLLKGEVIDNLVKHYNFSPDWLFKGLGEPFPGARRNYPEVCGPEADAVYIKDPLEAYAAGGAQKINIDEAMGKTYEVLKSGAPYAVALYLNIQQFKGAVDTTREVQVCHELITGLQTQVDDLRRQMLALTAPPITAEQQAASLQKEAM